MADEEKPTGPLDERINHSKWKWRVHGYEELASKFKSSVDGSGPLFNEWGPKFKTILLDANPMAQEKGLEALLAFIERCDVVNKFSSTFISVLVDKCFPSSRPKVKDKTIEALLGCIEADAGETVCESLITGTKNPSPKILLASLIAIKECLKTFGPKVFSVKPILREFKPWFEHRDKNVREEASNILIEMYRWIGKPLETMIQEGLTPIQLKGLVESFEKLPKEPAIPLKLTRSEAAKQLANAAKGGSSGGASAKQEVVQEEIDTYSLIPSVNILGKLTEEFYTGVKAAKWSERQTQIDELVKILEKSPKIDSGDYGTLANVLKKLIADVNVNIMTKAVMAVGLLAEGLRGSFTSLSKQFVTPILERFKEKKASIVQALHTTLDSLINKCLSMNDIMEDITNIMTNTKLAQVKQEVFNFLQRVISTTKKPQDIQKNAKAIAKICMDNISDTSEPVRESCSKCFGALGGIIGDRGMNPYFTQMDPIKAKKVKDLMPAVQVSATPQPTISIQAVDVSDLDLGSGSKKPSAGTSKKPAAASGKTTTTTTTTTAASKPTTTGAKTTASNKATSGEEVQDKIKSIIPEDQLNGLVSTNWKERLQSMEDINETVKGMTGDTLQSMSEYFILYLQEKPGWKESNFQVMSLVLELISFLVKNDPSFNKNTSNHYLTMVIEKISDVKLKDTAIDCLLQTAEIVTPQHVLSVLYPFAQSHKNPKVTADSLVLVSQIIEEFGVGACNVKMLIDFAKSCLESTQPTIKKSAISLLCTIRICVGPGISDFLSDVKKQLLTEIDKEFQKVSDQRPSPPTRSYKGAPAAGSQAAKSMGELPRTDISGKISSQCLDNMSDNNWKTRSDALEEVERIIIDANKRIQPKLGSLVTALKNRLSDSNQKVITSTLNVISLLSQSIGAPFDKNSKILLPGVLALLSDSKKPVRDAVLSCMTQLLQDLGFDVFVGCIGGPMLLDSATAKKEALFFATTNWNVKTVVQADMFTLCKPICLGLTDKNSEVRTLSEQLLNLASQYLTMNDFKKEFREVKQANLNTVTSIIEKHYKNKSSQPPPQTAKGKSAANVVTPNTASPNKVTATTTTTTTTSTNSANTTPTIIKSRTSNINNNNNDIIIYNQNGKSSRQKENNGKAWSFEEPTEEIEEILQGQVLQSFSEEFANLMFASNPSQAQQMQEIFINLMEQQESFELISSVIDVIFRWITFKLFDMGLASQKRILKILEVLLQKCISNEYTLSDYEASCLVPLLTEKMSSSNESIKTLIKQSVRQLEELCPANLIFKYIIENCKSSNWRTRLECIGELANLIDKSGTSIFGGANNLKIAVQLISQNLNEPNIKPSCILCFQKLYLHIRDEIWKILPQNLSPQDKSLISSNPPSVKKQSQTTTTTSSSSSNSSGDETLNQFNGYLDLLKNYVIGKNEELTVESLKQFSTFITQSQKPVVDKFIGHLENYLLAITKILNEIFPNVFQDPALFRLCKYLIHAIITIFSNSLIAKQSNTKSLQIVLTESIKLLVLPQPTEQSQDSDWLTKAFNQVLLRVLQNSNGTTLFTTLLQMITISKQNSKTNSGSEKYNDLLLRCLLRATKLLKPTPQQPSISQDELDIPVIFTEINKFLSTSQNLDETTKRATKTLTTELVNIKGPLVFQFIKDLISTLKHSSFTPLINLLTELLGKQVFEDSVGYIPPPIDIKLDSKLDNVVSNLSSNNINISNISNNNNNSSKSNSNLNIGSSSSSISSNISSSNNPTTSKLTQLKHNTEPRNYRATVKTDDEKKETLTSIFKKIGNTQLTTDGIHDLYYFLKEFPEIDITPHLNLTTPSFQSYINRNLSKVRETLENPKEKSEDEFKKYSENLTKIQNSFHQANHPQVSNLQQQQQQNISSGNLQQSIQSNSMSTLQRTRDLTNTIPSSSNPTPPSGPTNLNGSSNDLHSTVASLRQRLAQIKEKSNE